MNPSIQENSLADILRELTTQHQHSVAARLRCQSFGPLHSPFQSIVRNESYANISVEPKYYHINSQSVIAHLQ